MLHALLNLILPPALFQLWGRNVPSTIPCAGGVGGIAASSPLPGVHYADFPFLTNCKTRKGQSLCLVCHRQPPLYIQARSALAYDEGSRRFVIKFKHGDGTYLAPALAAAMMRVGQDILDNTDILIPVPLHWQRLFWRQYNQATLLSLSLTRQTGIPNTNRYFEAPPRNTTHRPSKPAKTVMRMSGGHS